jgi:hypothetical protein
MEPKTVAYVLPRDIARRVLHGAECLDRALLVRLDRDADPDTESVLILREGTEDDGQAISDAIVLALGTTVHAFFLDVDAPIPEGFAHDRVFEVGEDPTLTKRARRVVEVIPPVRFCE